MAESRGRLISLELERMMMHAGSGRERVAVAGPKVFGQVLTALLDRGWVADPGDGDPVDRVIQATPGTRSDESWSCGCDVTTSLFETTVSPTTSLADLDHQQQGLDAVLRPVLGELGLTLLHLETQPAVPPSRELFAQTSANWRQPYRVRAERGEDAYWVAWLAASTPCVDVPVREAIRALRMMLRLTPIALLLSRSGSVVGGRRSPDGRLTIRPWAHRRVFAASPHAADLRRVLPPAPELGSWRDYFGYLLELPTFVLTGVDQPGVDQSGVDQSGVDQFGVDQPGEGRRGTAGHAVRLPGDPPFRVLWDSGDPQWTIRHFEQLQRHVFFTRPRWRFGPDARLPELRAAYHAGEPALLDYLERHLVKLYLELRPDSPAPPGEDLCLLALWLGLLENLDTAEAYVDRYPLGFWTSLLDAAQFAPFATRLAGHWLPDLAGDLVAIAERGLARRGLGESSYLAPLVRRINRLSTPAEDIVHLFESAATPSVAIERIVERYAWRPLPVPSRGGA